MVVVPRDPWVNCTDIYMSHYEGYPFRIINTESTWFDADAWVMALSMALLYLLSVVSIPVSMIAFLSSFAVCATAMAEGWLPHSLLLVGKIVGVCLMVPLFQITRYTWAQKLPSWLVRWGVYLTLVGNVLVAVVYEATGVDTFPFSGLNVLAGSFLILFIPVPWGRTGQTAYAGSAALAPNPLDTREAHPTTTTTPHSTEERPCSGGTHNYTSPFPSVNLQPAWIICYSMWNITLCSDTLITVAQSKAIAHNAFPGIMAAMFGPFAWLLARGCALCVSLLFLGLEVVGFEAVPVLPSKPRALVARDAMYSSAMVILWCVYELIRRCRGYDVGDVHTYDPVGDDTTHQRSKSSAKNTYINTNRFPPASREI